MSYILIGQQILSLPFLTRIEASSLEEALRVTRDMVEEPDSPWVTKIEEDGSESGWREPKNNGFQAWFILDESSGEFRRIYYNDKQEIKVADAQSAFELLGRMTDSKHYEGGVEADTETVEDSPTDEALTES